MDEFFDSPQLDQKLKICSICELYNKGICRDDLYLKKKTNLISVAKINNEYVTGNGKRIDGTRCPAEKW